MIVAVAPRVAERRVSTGPSSSKVVSCGIGDRGAMSVISA